MRAWASGIVFLVALAPCLSLADGPLAHTLLHDGRYTLQPPRIDGLGVLLGEAKGMRLWSALPERLPWLRAVLPRGLPAGGDIVGTLSAYQTHFSDPVEGNVALLIWDEASSSPGGVAVLVDGEKVGMFFDGGPAFITSLDPGAHLFRVEAAGPSVPTYAEAALTILQDQPFGDVKDLRCEDAVKGEGGACQVLFGWTAPETLPSFYLVLLDDDTVGKTPDAIATAITAASVAPGTHRVTVIGFLRASPGSSQTMYRGRFVTAACTVACEGEACSPPASLRLCQAGYGPGDSDNRVRLDWANARVSYPGGMDVSLDGNMLSHLANEATGMSPTLAFLEGLPAGEHRIGIRGACGPLSGGSSITEAGLTLRAETPFTDSVQGDVVCRFDPAAGATTASWTSGRVSDFIDVYVLRPDFHLSFVGTLPGSSGSATVAGTSSADEVVVLQYFAIFDGACYGSKPMGCIPAPGDERRFVRGFCDGQGAANISSAVFELSFLFLGGPPPPCLEACDVDGDSLIDITDPVYLLSFLFLGGPAPAGWAERLCQTTSPDRCSVSHDTCR